jgi:hypothetical protein
MQATVSMLRPCVHKSTGTPQKSQQKEAEKTFRETILPENKVLSNYTENSRTRTLHYPLQEAMLRYLPIKP